MSLPFGADNQSHNQDTSQERQTTPGGQEAVKWRVLTSTAGILPAELIVARLQAEEIPARAWQEGAGRALGLTVGKLGTAKVVVPEEYLDEAQEILAADAEAEENWDEDYPDE